MARLGSPKELDEYRQAQVAARDTAKTLVRVCSGTGCTAFGSAELRAALEAEIAESGLSESVEVHPVGCLGLCECGPIVEVLPANVFYEQVTPEDAAEIVRETVGGGGIITRLLHCGSGTANRVASASDIPFFARQKRIVFRNAGIIDPRNIDDYIARDGYAALAKVLDGMSQQDVIEQMKTSGLRGRGGGGFPTGAKWEMARNTPSDTKYVVCNRGLIEGDPHSVIEGMAICAYAIGARTGYLYLRVEARPVIDEFETAIAQATDAGLIGDGILGTDFSFDVKIAKCDDAFVVGEETAALELIEGKRGMPRLKPPFPAQRGLWRKPTVVNNIETFATVAPIVLNGADWYAQTGCEGCSGTKVFALTGAVKDAGLIEVPVGTTLREIIFDIGGGIPRGRVFKSAQIGGPTGGVIDAQFLDTPITYESLAEAGAIKGSGGIAVADETSCMVETARFYADFVVGESCGKCVPCRIGSKRMAEILAKITEGNGVREDIGRLKVLAESMRDASLCDLGKTGANPVLSTIRYFEDEYLAHIDEGRCPAGVCDALSKAPCNNACPARIDTSSYVALVGNGRYVDAVAVHRERNPFAFVCGRTCHHPCEVRCRRGDVDQPISIRALKRFMADASGYANEPLPVSKGKAVAVVGSGPAGLSCAYQLALCGYQVTVFEKLPVAGGMMTVGIPEYRLPKKLVAREVEAIEELGVKLELGKALGVDFTVDGLLKDGFSAVFLAIGAHKGKKARIDKEDAEGVIQGVDYLRSLVVGEPMALGKRVAVIGGGDVALDAARSAVRHGAKHVTVVYRRSREEMPAHEWDIVEGEEEGIVYEYMTAPTGVIVRDGRAGALRCVRTELGERDESGRRSPVVIEGSEFEIDADSIILAIGQDVDLSGISADDGVQLEGGRRLSADERYMTSRPGVFAGGDGLTGPAALVEAVGAGQKAAFEIDRYVSGSCVREAELIAREGRLVERAPEADVATERVPERALDPTVRSTSDVEVTLTMSEAEAVSEARRCLRCDRERAENRAETAREKAKAHHAT